MNRLRDMLALEDGDTLWLAPGTPRRWLESSDGIRVNGIVTYFGWDEDSASLAAARDETLFDPFMPVTARVRGTPHSERHA